MYIILIQIIQTQININQRLNDVALVATAQKNDTIFELTRLGIIMKSKQINHNQINVCMCTKIKVHFNCLMLRCINNLLHIIIIILSQLERNNKYIFKIIISLLF